LTPRSDATGPEPLCAGEGTVPELVGVGDMGGAPTMSRAGILEPLKESASTRALVTAAPPRAMDPKRRLISAPGIPADPAVAGTSPPADPVSPLAAAAAAVPASAAMPAAAPAAAASSTDVRGPAAGSSPPSPRSASVEGVTGRIRTGASSVASMTASPPRSGSMSASAPRALASCSRRRDSRSPSASPPATEDAPSQRLALRLDALGTPVRRSTARPRSRRTDDGSTWASPPIGTTALGQTRITLASGANSRVSSTAAAPIPSPSTMTSGSEAWSVAASAAESAASPTTS
jgi:hypothetical protein